jgi:hypothetical protein
MKKRNLAQRTDRYFHRLLQFRNRCVLFSRSGRRMTVTIFPQTKEMR